MRGPVNRFWLSSCCSALLASAGCDICTMAWNTDWSFWKVTIFSTRPCRVKTVCNISMLTGRASRLETTLPALKFSA